MITRYDWGLHDSKIQVTISVCTEMYHFFCVWLQGHVWSIGDRVFVLTLGEGDRVSLGDTTLEEETGGVWEETNP